MREIKIEKVDKTVRVSRELREEIKRMGLESKIKFMRKELVDCPLQKKKISPLYCLVCEYFVRRYKGVIHCKYP
jgi:hypothetical protein